MKEETNETNETNEYYNLLSQMVREALTRVEFNPSKDTLSELMVVLEKALPVLA